MLQHNQASGNFPNTLAQEFGDAITFALPGLNVSVGVGYTLMMLKVGVARIEWFYHNINTVQRRLHYENFDQ